MCSQLGFMKVEHGKSMFRGSSHWALVLSEVRLASGRLDLASCIPICTVAYLSNLYDLCI